MPEKRIHRKDLRRKLKEDEFAVFVTDLRMSIGDYLGRYGRLIFWSAIGVVLLIGFVTLWKWKQEADFATVQEAYSVATTQIGSSDYVSAQSTLSDLIDRYGGQECVPAALALRGYARHKQGDYSGALSDYRSALEKTDDPATRYSLRVSVAQCLRSLGQTEEAVGELESVRAEINAGAMRDQVTYLLAQCKEDLNQPGQALALYSEIDEKSEFHTVARERVSWLETQSVVSLN